MVHLHVTMYVCIRKLNNFYNFTMALPGYIMYIMGCYRMSLFMTLCALEPRTDGHLHSFLQKLIKTQNAAERLTQFFTRPPNNPQHYSNGLVESSDKIKRLN